MSEHVDSVTVSGAFRICGQERSVPSTTGDSPKEEICVEDPGHADGRHRWMTFWRENPHAGETG